VAFCLLFAFAAAFTEKEYEDAFTKWMVEFQKSYAPEEFFYRYEVFKSTFDFIADYNSQNHTAVMGLNQFSDLTSAEFKLTFNGYKPELRRGKRAVTLGDLEKPQYPGTLDWRTKGAVTPVKNQGQCGSCWAFSTTGSMEGVIEIKHGTLTSLSEQELVDCAGSYGNYGCNGGLMDYAFKFAETYGLTTEANYPYVGRNEACNTAKRDQPSANTKLTGYKDVATMNANALGTATDLNPVSVAIEADQAVFQNYKSGIISSGCGTSLDHGVLVVGYGTEGTTDYWTVKNSWGTTWGEAGYVRINRAGDVCGILMEPSYPVD
jgi:C1A family cysteine protease